MDEVVRDAPEREPVGRAVPSLEELSEALAAHAGVDGLLWSGVAAALAKERGWTGRVMEVLAVLTEDTARMGYLAGGRKPDEVMSWVPLWADAPFSLEQIRTIVGSGGWDPEPFEVVVRNGLLERFVTREDGRARHLDGELAGAWLSDRYALADDDEILRAVRNVVEGERATA